MARDPVIKYFAGFVKNLSIRKSLVFLNQETFADKIQICDKAWHIHGMPHIEHNRVTGVLNRLLTDSKHSKHTNIENMHVLARYLMNHIYPGVLNKPASGMSNFSKPYQLGIIDLRYIHKPYEIITNDMRSMGAKKDTRWIKKSICATRSIVNIHKQSAKIGFEPVLLQEYLVGINIRVHVIGLKYSASQIIANAVDYRYAKKIRQKDIVLPTKIAKECIDIARQLDLPFAGIDLIYAQKKYWILEVNPAPGYHFFENNKKSISKALLAYWFK